MHPEILAPATGKCLAKLNTQSFLKTFYLIGGTAIALHLGHRQSVDLDFVSEGPIDTLSLRQELSQCGDFVLDVESKNTLHGALDQVKVSLMTYVYPRLDEPVVFDGIQVAGLRDLAAMKLDTLAARGKRRDFVDVYAIAQTGVPLQEMKTWFEQKYQGLQYNLMHLIKSMTYFEDAENDPEPVYITPIVWDQVKTFFLKESRRLVP